VGGSTDRAVRTGLFYGLSAYLLWGIVPVYFKAVSRMPPLELLAHRIASSALLLVALLALLGRFKELVACLSHARSLQFLLLSTIFIAANWYVFIYSVISNQIMQGSLGYFILPLVNVAIGTIFFHERMRPPQWIAIALAAAGVLVLTFWDGRFPWIALTLAFSFSIYGVLRKQAAVDATVGLAVETLLLTPLSLIVLCIIAAEGRLVFGHVDRGLDALVLVSGLVTSVPLICFAQAVQRLRIVTIGILQYISPSLAFVIAVICYDEQFPLAYQFGYGLIWFGLVVFVVDAMRQTWNSRGNVGEIESRKEADVVPLD
jgi:chloramphenicol-sensitive protein RarD